MAEDVQKLDTTGLPSKEFTYQLMQTNPELVWQMVRKLYALEQNLPVLTLPALTVLEEKPAGTLIIGYQGTPEALLWLGNNLYNIEYKIKLETTVIAGYKVPVKVPVYVWFAGGAAILVSGFLMGISVH